MSDNVSKIKDRLNIVDVISIYLKLEKAGINLKAPCPFHNEKTPSFFVSPDRGTYKCFGCGAGGDMFSFVEQFEGVDFVGALKILAEKAGVELVKENSQEKDEKNKLYEIIEEATCYFELGLSNKKEAQEYLKNRGLKEETIKKFRIGFAKNDWKNLYDFLKSKNFKDEDIEKVGLIKKKEGGSGFYDRFRGRIIFPLFDNSGRAIGFSGRLFEAELQEGRVEQAKYLNSPETILFNKSKILYGYNFAKNDIRKRDFSIFVEGQMDLVMSHQAGFSNTVATSGTSLTLDHLLLIKRLSNKIMMAFDGDSAGLAAANKGSKLALGIEMEVKLVEIPENSDPADLILKNKDAWAKSIKNAVHIIDFNLNVLISQEKDKRKLGLKISEIVLPLVMEVKNKIEQSYFIAQISLKTGIHEKVLLEELARADKMIDASLAKVKTNLIESKKEKQQSSKKQKTIKEISGIIYWQKSLEEPVIDILEAENRLKEILGEDVSEKIKNLPETLVNEIIFEAENLYIEANNLQAKLEELFLNLEKGILIDERNLIFEKLKQIESGGDEEKKYLEKYYELSKKIEGGK